MIKETLSKADAEELFSREAILFFEMSAIPEFRLYELLGENAADFVDKQMKNGGCLVGGKDYGLCGSGTEERPMLLYFYKTGFLKLVSEHNYLLSLASNKNSDGGRIADEIRKRRRAEIERKDREDEAKREARRQKRAAAKAEREAKEEHE